MYFVLMVGHAKGIMQQPKQPVPGSPVRKLSSDSSPLVSSAHVGVHPVVVDRTPFGSKRQILESLMDSIISLQNSKKNLQMSLKKLRKDLSKSLTNARAEVDILRRLMAKDAAAEIKSRQRLVSLMEHIKQVEASLESLKVEMDAVIQEKHESDVQKDGLLKELNSISETLKRAEKVTAKQTAASSKVLSGITGEASYLIDKIEDAKARLASLDEQIKLAKDDRLVKTSKAFEKVIKKRKEAKRAAEDVKKKKERELSKRSRDVEAVRLACEGARDRNGEIRKTVEVEVKVKEQLCEELKKVEEGFLDATAAHEESVSNTVGGGGSSFFGGLDMRRWFAPSVNAEDTVKAEAELKSSMLLGSGSDDLFGFKNGELGGNGGFWQDDFGMDGSNGFNNTAPSNTGLGGLSTAFSTNNHSFFGGLESAPPGPVNSVRTSGPNAGIKDRPRVPSLTIPPVFPSGGMIPLSNEEQSPLSNVNLTPNGDKILNILGLDMDLGALPSSPTSLGPMTEFNSTPASAPSPTAVGSAASAAAYQSRHSFAFASNSVGDNLFSKTSQSTLSRVVGSGSVTNNSNSSFNYHSHQNYQSQMTPTSSGSNSGSFSDPESPLAMEHAVGLQELLGGGALNQALREHHQGTGSGQFQQDLDEATALMLLRRRASQSSGGRF
jgi:hypothetical protein